VVILRTTRDDCDIEHFPDAAQRDSVAPLIRDRGKLRVCKDPGSAAHHFVMRCARERLR
jgi:hypothetical protein